MSRVLNDSPHVASATRRRVLRAMRTLGYEPNNLARNLRSQRVPVYGLVIADIQNPFFTAVARGVEDAAREATHSVLLCNTDEDPEKEAGYLRTLRAERVAGIIIAPTRGTIPDLEALVQAGIAIVAIDRRLDLPRVDTVLTDNAAGIAAAVRHLVADGHRDIGLVGGPEHVTSMREREQAYARTLAELGIGLRREWLVRGDLREDGGYAAARRILAARARPRALIGANNLMTLGALRAVREVGLRVPSDIAVVGFDDFPGAHLLDPPLTTLAQPTYDIGRKAAAMLLARLADAEGTRVEVLLKPELIVRDSCAPSHGI